MMGLKIVDGVLVDDWGFPAHGFGGGMTMDQGPKTCPKLAAHQAWVRILAFFQGDHFRAIMWFHEKHPLLGDIAPAEMMKLGRHDKLLRWIQTQLNEN